MRSLFCIHSVSNIIDYNYAATYYTKYMPTREQLLMAVQVCHLLSEMMQPIEVFLYSIFAIARACSIKSWFSSSVMAFPAQALAWNTPLPSHT